MRHAFRAAIDRRCEGLIVAWLRRRWPVLRLVPAGWMRPLITPTATRMRRSLSQGLLAVTLSGGVVLTLVAVVG
jgi:hypothetical protein